MPEEKPLIFISHKHTESDIAIATTVAEVIKNRTLNAVRIFQSSNWKFEGTRVGSNLDAGLRRALWDSDAVILIYTSDDQNWQYCMYECGVATQTDDPDPRIVVFQCSQDVPTPFASKMRVNVRNANHVKRFTKQLLTDPEFFPKRAKALAPGCDDEAVEQMADDLYTKLRAVVPDVPPVEWPAWPFLRIELPEAEADKLVQAEPVERAKKAREVVEQHAVVIKSDMRTAALFGLQDLSEKHKFGDLLQTWKSNFPSSEATWFDSCCEQIMKGARREFPVIRWARLRQVGTDAEYTPVLSHVKRQPFGNKSTHFDIYFYNLSDPHAVPVELKMIHMGAFFYKSLSQVRPESLKLVELLGELEQRGLNRIPLFSAEAHPLYIIHRSMIDKFLVQRMLAGVTPNDVTLADLLADREMTKVFEETFVAVRRQASLAEARDAMVARPGCNDVFVTEDGGRDEPVIGWLTNVDLVK
ncbi:MAG TPA: TIR domain-containing protein [Pyrinomonadaceae bacterium]|nr:TIR domain-containing protein [Pyrinomonadaceae bacterium]